MPLDDLLWKDPVISTVSADKIAQQAEECETIYGFHHATYTAVPEITQRWNRILSRLCKGQASLGVIYAPIGFGKTAAAVDLWYTCEQAGIVCVPPFVCTSLRDMAVTTYSWLRHKLAITRPDLCAGADSAFREIDTRTDDEWVSRMAISHAIPEDSARSLLADLRQTGSLRSDVSPSAVLKFLERSVDVAVAAGYKGLVVLADEFKLFIQSSNDKDANISTLQQLVWGIMGEQRPLGLVLSMPETTYAEIRLKSEDILQRLGSHEISLNLLQVYGQDFPRLLWRQMVTNLSLDEREAHCVSDDALSALGQFCARTDLFDGPRSVIAAFKKAALKYKQTGEPYEVLDLVRDYTSGVIVFDGKETPAAASVSGLLAMYQGDDRSSLAIQLLAAYPEGCPQRVSDAYGVTDAMAEVARKYMGDRVIYQALGPTLRVYRSNESRDPITESLRVFSRQYNPADRSCQRASLRAFCNIILSKIIRKRQGLAILGWSGWRDVPIGEPLDVHTCVLTGAPNEGYPSRRVSLTVAIDRKYLVAISEDVHLAVSILLDCQPESRPSIEFDGIEIRMVLPINRVIDAARIPRDIAKLQDIFLPQDVTPQLLLAVSEFLDRTLLNTDALGANEKRVTGYLVNTTFAERVIRELFGEELRGSLPADIPIGSAFFDAVLGYRLLELFPQYVPLATIPSPTLDKYILALSSTTEPRLSLSQKRGHAPASGTKGEIASKLGYTSHSTFREAARSQLQNLLEVVEWEGSKDDSRAEVRFVLHPLESLVLDLLRASENRIDTDGVRVRVLSLSDLIRQAAVSGYLEDEVKSAVRLLIGRGYCSQKEIKGRTVIHETVYKKTASEVAEYYLSLKRDLERYLSYEAASLDAVFGSAKFDFSADVQRVLSLEESGADVQEQVDDLQHGVEAASTRLSNHIAGRLVNLAKGDVQTALEAAAAYKDRPIPAIIDATKKPIPTTDFSPLLQAFQVQLATEFRESCNQYASNHERLQSLLQKYQDEVASSRIPLSELYQNLLDQFELIRDSMKACEQRAELLNERISQFQRWYDVAKTCSDFTVRLLTQKPLNPLADSLYDKLQKGVVFEIRQDLATRKLKALSDWEIFLGRLQEIINEWETAAEERRRGFLKVVQDYRDALQESGISQFDLDPAYDDADPTVGMARLRSGAKTILEAVMAKVETLLSNTKAEILKADKVYDLDQSVDVASLERACTAVELTAQRLRLELTDELVGDLEKLREWLERLQQVIHPEGSLIGLRDEVELAVSSIAKQSLKPDEARLLEAIRKAQGNLTQVLVSALATNEVSCVEEFLRILSGLYRKGRVNLEAKITALGG